MKIVRDKLDALIPAAALRTARAEEIIPLLLAKVREETGEIEDSNCADIGEFGDALESLMALAAAAGHQWADVEAARVAKRNARGGFEKGLVYDPSADMVDAIVALGKAMRLDRPRG